MASELEAAEAACQEAVRRIQTEGLTWNAIAAYLMTLVELRQALSEAA